MHAQFLSIAADLSPALQAAIEHNGPIELAANQSSPFPDRLCRAVAGQQLSVRAAETIWGRVVASADGEPLMAYFARVDAAVLKSCGLSRAKVRTVGAIAQAASAGQLDATELSQLSHAERTERLTMLWGVGQWTADMMGIFYFGDPDIWPEGDLAARKTLEKLTSARRKTVLTATRFAPYRSILALHMWRAVDTALPVD
ncbi:MAG: DNA-3-methyladenine glycosylase 2 family protein [Cyanobacteria bacterium J06598_1]